LWWTIKEELVFKKSTGALIGFDDLEGISNLLSDAQNQINDPDNHRRPLAKVTLVFMVRGLPSSFKYSYVNFPATSAQSVDLFPFFVRLNPA